MDLQVQKFSGFEHAETTCATPDSHSVLRMAKRAVPKPSRIIVPILALAAMWPVGSCGVASAAPIFDVEGYSACTATTVPTPDQDFDAVVANCCVQHAGVPTPTRYGMGCVAATDATSVDERPTIVLPTRPVPPEKADSDLSGLIDMPLPEPPP